MASYLLGVDIGTTSCKCVAFAPDGSCAAESSSEYPVYRPRPHWAEQEASDWWEGARKTIREVVAALEPGSTILAIGLSGQMPTHVFVNRSGEPIRRSVIWQDARAISEAERLREMLTEETMRKYLGVTFPIVPTLPPPRMIWFAQNEPDLIEGTFKMLQAKDYVNYRLTGVMATDRTSSLGLANINTKAYVDEYIQLLGIPPRILPDIYEPYEVIGRVTRDASAETGLAPGVPVVSGWIDAWCNMLGTGLGCPGMAFDVTGTSEIVGLTSAGASTDTKGLLAIPLYNDMTIIYGLTNAGGDSIRWFRDNVCAPSRDSGRVGASFEDLEKEARDTPAGSEGLLFLPYLDGERSPIWDPSAKGAFVGLNRRHTQGHLARAIMEGVAFSVKQILSRAEAVGRTSFTSIRLSGGGTRSDVWNRIKASVLGVPAEIVETRETAALGAAMLAAIGLGLATGYADAVQKMVRIREVIDPLAEDQAVYAELFGLYEQLYPAIKHITERLWL